MDILKEYDLRFSRYEKALEAFAGRHNLLFEKYDKEVPIWSFCFSHPLGGQAQVRLIISDAGKVTVYPIWWIDSLQSHARSIKQGRVVEVPHDEPSVVSALSRALDEALSWKLGEWTRVAGGYEHRQVWGRYTEAQFRAIEPRWPEPRQ